MLFVARHSFRRGKRSLIARLSAAQDCGAVQSTLLRWGEVFGRRKNHLFQKIQIGGRKRSTVRSSLGTLLVFGGVRFSRASASTTCVVSLALDAPARASGGFRLAAPVAGLRSCGGSGLGLAAGGRWRAAALLACCKARDGTFAPVASQPSAGSIFPRGAMVLIAPQLPTFISSSLLRFDLN
jgi:hypothetical protein